jgi:hypothetical protein
MIHIKRFIDRVSTMEARPGRDLVMPSVDARALRDEIAKLLAERLEESSAKRPDEVIEVVVQGGRW